MEQLIQRRVQGIARQRITESPVVLLQGPRTVGKSTLLRALAEEHGGHVVDFDEPAVRAAAADDPGLFVVGRRPVFIDEYQHVPEVLDSIKAELNRDGSPGQFVITGSTRFDSLPLAAQSLTGRLHRIEIHPLSQGEIGERRENLLESLFTDASTVATPQASATTRAEYADRITRGGFPLAQERTDSSRARWFDDYLALCLERWFSELTTKWLKRGTHRSVTELKDSINTWTDNWNDNPRPFTGHKTADQIFDTWPHICNKFPTQDIRRVLLQVGHRYRLACWMWSRLLPLGSFDITVKSDTAINYYSAEEST